MFIYIIKYIVKMTIIEEVFKQNATKIRSMQGFYHNDGIDPLLMTVFKLHHSKKVVGNVAEIGVHMGRSFMPLLLLCQDKRELAIAVDCFEQKEFNVDNSGGGNLNIFKKSCQQLRPNLENITIVAGDSNKLTAKDYQSYCTNKLKYKVFSIDGSHTKSATIHDLKNAMAVMDDYGVIIIDDYLNLQWPGVRAGVNHVLSEDNTYRPFYIGYNKILLCKAKVYNTFWSFFKGAKHDIANKNSEIYKSVIPDVQAFEKRMWLGEVWKKPGA